MQRTLMALVVAVCASLAAGSAHAATIQVMAEGPNGELGFAGNLDESDGVFTELPNGLQSWVGSVVDDSGWEFSWDLVINPDPFVTGVVAVTNNTNSTGTFMFEVGTSVTDSFAAGSPMFGSSTISISDANNSNSASLSAPAGGSVYEGRINGIVQESLFDAPYTLSPSFPPSTAGDTESFTGTTSTALNVGDTLSLKHTFVLSAGDSATGNSNFTVIPEPSTLALAALLGLAGCVHRLRRRATEAAR